MNDSLKKLIVTYRKKARKLVPLLAAELNIDLPMTNNEWAALQIEQWGETSSGLKYFKHGSGVAIRYKGWEIDIDFGDKGEADGFDACKLFNFASSNGLPIPYKNEKEIEIDIARAVADGDVKQSGYIFYFNKK